METERTNSEETAGAKTGSRAEAESATRTSIRVSLPEEILQALRRRAEERSVSLYNYTAYILTRAVIEE